ncbi:MAG: DNA topoisomerase-1, partial [Sphingobacteriales bacterium]
ENPRDINVDLVNAQQARRILDRLVGFELSPVLWRKVKPGLSAGRVQSVTVRLIVEREDEVKAFVPVATYKTSALFELSNGQQFKADLQKRFSTLEETRDFLKKIVSPDFSIESVETKPAKKTPTPPFTTSTLQQEASRKLGYSVVQTMANAQKLYEQGLITYMRTDSTNLSESARQDAEKQITADYGAEYAHTRSFKTKTKGAQEAHEAIRPTDFGQRTSSIGNYEDRLYQLIWKRAIASQMSDAQLEKTTVKIRQAELEYNFVGAGEVLKFEGFLKVYLEGKDDENEEDSGMLPAMNEGETLLAVSIESRERFSNNPPRYTEASLVRRLEELGIGRPSTYAPTISTIQKRGYVVKEDREGVDRAYKELIWTTKGVEERDGVEIAGREKSKLFPTDIGGVVNQFLTEHFSNILSYNFTADVEKEFDEIAMGQKEWRVMLDQFYKPFHETVDHTIEHSEKATGERELGKDPATGKPIITRIGRFGPMVQLGDAEDEEKKFASLRTDQSITTITLEEALDLFKLPRGLGDYEGYKVSAAIGRFGPYIRHNGKFVSIPEESNPFEITFEQAIELIEEKREKDKKALIKTFEENEEVRILEGRYGPYIKFGKDNVKIPKDAEPKDLTYADCVKLKEEQDKKPKRKKAPKKK